MRWLNAGMLLVMAAMAANAGAQALYKYVDKDGKITYSDRVPKPGEKAELVTLDPKLNVLEGYRAGASAAAGPSSGLAEQRVQKRNKLQADVDAARVALDKAKQALESGRESTPEERQIIVRSTGGNSVVPKQAYYDRIAGLEAAVKTAQENLDKAENAYRRGAPD